MQNGSSWQRTSFGTLDESLSGLGHSSIVGSLMLTRPGGRTHNASWIDPRFFEDILLDPIEPKFGLRQSMEEAVAKGCWRTEAERERRAMVWGRDEGEMVLIETGPVFGVIVLSMSQPRSQLFSLSERPSERRPRRQTLKEEEFFCHYLLLLSLAMLGERQAERRSDAPNLFQDFLSRAFLLFGGPSPAILPILHCSVGGPVYSIRSAGIPPVSFFPLQSS